MKNSTKRKWKKGIAVRAAALTFFVTILLVYGTGMVLFSDFVFLSNNKNAVTPSAAFLAPSAADTPVLLTQTHMETPGQGSPAPRTEDKNGYTYVAATFREDENTMTGLLAEAGIPYEIRYGYSTKRAGTLLTLDYAGYSDETGYYINPAVPVTLHVSGNKLETTPYDGTNRVYITFDDGPTAYTDRILDTLGQLGVPATFFTLGTSVEKYPATARRITGDGHLLASHGATHQYETIYQNADALLKDVQKWQEITTRHDALPDRADRYFRFPGGSVGSYFGENQRQEMIAGLHQMGYRVYDWNILTNDGVLFLRPDGMDSRTYWKETFLKTWEECPSGTRIILLHDSTPETAELLTWMIYEIADRGYTFGTLDQLDVEYFMK